MDYLRYVTQNILQEILESLEDVGSGPFGCRRIVLEETNEKNKKEKDARIKHESLSTPVKRINRI